MRQMHLALFVLGTGNHTAGWRYEGGTTSNRNWPVMQAIAQTAERGKFDLFFLGDNLAMDPRDHPSFMDRFEPMTILSALAVVTSRIGLGATMSTSFSEPFHVARVFASLDHLSNGRAAWNVVTSTKDVAALNFSQERLNEHDLRYEIAGEFVDVVRGLWDTWSDGAIVADKASGRYLDATKVKALDHIGRFFKVKGPLNIARCPQGHPVIIQAGGSPPGQELSARQADIVFSVVNGDPVSAKAKLRQPEGARGQARPGAAGRLDPAGRHADHRRNRRPGEGATRQAPGFSLLHQRHGAGVRAARLRHFELSPGRSGAGFSGQDRTRPVVLQDSAGAGATREHDVARSLQRHRGSARSLVIYGSPKRIADTLEEWFETERADGFMIQPAYFSGALDDFVDKVVPELQRRGLFRREYSGPTLRDHLGVAAPVN